jgi:hypothetical protein
MDVITPDETTPLRAEVDTMPDTARALTIVDDRSFHTGATLLRRIKTLRDAIDRLFAPHITRAFEAHRALVADRKRLERPLAEAEAVLKAHLAAYTVAEERRRAAEARRQTAAAAEARASQIWAEVEQLEATGYHAEAADLATALVTTTDAIVVAPTPVAADGITSRVIWKYEVVDAAQVPPAYLTIDHRKLGAAVRALKGSVPIPGVRMWAERTIAASRE